MMGGVIPGTGMFNKVEFGVGSNGPYHYGARCKAQRKVWRTEVASSSPRRAFGGEEKRGVNHDGCWLAVEGYH